MKKIILVRHGKSSWIYPHLADHDRPLGERGIRDLPIMGARLKKKGIIPDLILSSTARRAQDTAKIIAISLQIPESRIQLDPMLYHASADIIAAILKKQDNAHQTVAIVGHNPGMNEFIYQMNGKLENLPTSGQFGFTLNTEKWVELKPERMETWFVDYPKK